MSVLWFPKPSVDQLPSQAGGWLSPQTHSPFADWMVENVQLVLGHICIAQEHILHHRSSAALSLSYSVLLRGLFCPDRQSTAEAQFTRPRWHLHRAWHCPRWMDRWFIHSQLLATAWSQLPLHLSNTSLTTFPFSVYLEILLVSPRHLQHSHPHCGVSAGARLPGNTYPTSHSALCPHITAFARGIFSWASQGLRNAKSIPDGERTVCITPSHTQHLRGPACPLSSPHASSY